MSVEQAIQALTKYKDPLVSSIFKANQGAQKAEFYYAFEILHALKERHANFMGTGFGELNEDESSNDAIITLKKEISLLSKDISKRLAVRLQEIIPEVRIIPQ